MTAVFSVLVAACASDFGAGDGVKPDPNPAVFGATTGWRAVAAGGSGGCALGADGWVEGWGGGEEICGRLNALGPITSLHMGLVGVCAVNARGKIVAAGFPLMESQEVVVGPALSRVECPGDGGHTGETVDHVLRDRRVGRLIPTVRIRDFSLSPAFTSRCTVWVDVDGGVKGRCSEGFPDGSPLWAAFEGAFVEVAAFSLGACAAEESGRVECHLPSPALFGIETDLLLGGLHVNSDIFCGLDEQGLAHCLDPVLASSGEDPLLYPPDVPMRSIAGSTGVNCAITLEEERIVCWGELGDGMDSPP